MDSRNYSSALFELYQSDHPIDQLLRGLDRVLAHHGHEKLKFRILSDLLHLLAADTRKRTVRIVVQNDAARKTLTQAIEAEKKRLAVVADAPEVVEVNDALIGGYIIEYKDTRIDHSYKRTLVDLYRSVTL